MSTLPLFDRDEPPAKEAREGEDRVFRVSSLNRAARMLLEDRWRNVWVEGELSDVTHAASGHVYFTLNDEEEPAQLRGVMFRSDARSSRAKLEDGARVKMRGSLSIFEPRGSFQMIARIALPHGLGDLHAQFERTRQRLMSEGLMDPDRKRTLPQMPSTIGIVTSAAGAALHDVIRVAAERCPVRLVVAPCLVQGTEAPGSIVAALEAIQALDELDVVIVGRGGGAAEDLVAFNDERVARAIAACRVPIVSAVGHEVDVTIADLVADLRAATPSNAAELCVPARDALAAALGAHHRGLQRAMEVYLARARLRLERPAQRLADPRAVIASLRRRLEASQTALWQTIRARLARAREQSGGLADRLWQRDPRVLTANNRARLMELSGRLLGLASPLAEQRRARLAALAGRLGALSPLSVLARGYAIALHQRTGKALLRADAARGGDLLVLRLSEGQLNARVEEP